MNRRDFIKSAIIGAAGVSVPLSPEVRTWTVEGISASSFTDGSEMWVRMWVDMETLEVDKLFTSGDGEIWEEREFT